MTLTAVLRTCGSCQSPMWVTWPTKRFCSPLCSQRAHRGWPRERSCRHCGEVFKVLAHADSNRQLCSKRCAKKHAYRIRRLRPSYQDNMRRYRATHSAKRARLAKAEGPGLLELLQTPTPWMVRTA